MVTRKKAKAKAKAKAKKGRVLQEKLADAEALVNALIAENEKLRGIAPALPPVPPDAATLPADPSKPKYHEGFTDGFLAGKASHDVSRELETTSPVVIRPSEGGSA